jgi:hypothetical protein
MLGVLGRSGGSGLRWGSRRGKELGAIGIVAGSWAVGGCGGPGGGEGQTSGFDGLEIIKKYILMRGDEKHSLMRGEAACRFSYDLYHAASALTDSTVLYKLAHKLSFYRLALHRLALVASSRRDVQAAPSRCFRERRE